jgi:hypothetical protein
VFFHLSFLKTQPSTLINYQILHNNLQTQGSDFGGLSEALTSFPKTHPLEELVLAGVRCGGVVCRFAFVSKGQHQKCSSAELKNA